MIENSELLHELFETTVDRRPGRTAVQCGESRLTYQGLDELANRVAHALRARGVGLEDRVAILLPRSESVYVAMLAILKAGAAYVPLDSETPPERIRFILQDSGAKCLITISELAKALRSAGELPRPPKAGEGGGEGTTAILPSSQPSPAFQREKGLLLLDADEPEISKQPIVRLSRGQTGVSRENLCYVIYTSGTTGQPKGVLIEHRNVVHLIGAESKLYGILPEDRVFQLASPAFDASVEEIWMAFSHGATLVAGTPDILRSGPDFSSHLERLGVTVLSCVPTFLSMLERDIPTVRLLILGGEASPPGLTERWQSPGRVIFNTYGPTETTVIATASVMAPQRPVTIGRPIEGYQVFLLDEKRNLVAEGLPGEICIGGEGVARGYLNRPEIDFQKFIWFKAPTGQSVRLYRTADLARVMPDGELEYLGRLDDQVKVRGFRIELSEIEAALTQVPGVLAAAAAVHEPTQQIAAYIVPRASQGPDRFALRRRLLERLPKYMVPAFLEELPALPMTTAGKVDRKRLPEPHTPLLQERRARQDPRNDAERTVIDVWQSVLKRENISIRDDFFLDLDGHSLLAAAAVSKLRKKPGFESLSVGDLYARPTIEDLAQLVSASSGRDSAKPERSFHETSALRYCLCAIGQALGVVFISGVYAWQWLGPYLIYGYLVVEGWPIHRALWAAFWMTCGVTPVTLALSIVFKWLLLGRIRPGRYPLWGWFFWRFWFVRSLVRAAPVHYLDGTPLLNVYYRLMGARIGRDVYIGSHSLATFDVLSMDDGTSIGLNSSLDASSVEEGFLNIASLTIGKGVWVGSRCTMGAGAILGDGSGLDDLSKLPDGARVPAGELWRGSPAASAGKMPPGPVRNVWSVSSWIGHIIGIFLLPLVIIAAVFPGLMAITHLGHLDEGYLFLLSSPIVAFSFVVFLCAELWVFKWIVIGRLSPGCYPVGGLFYVRQWFFDQLMVMSTDVTEALYETLYAAPWLRALGARIGPRCEIAAIELVHPDLLEMDGESMIADLALIGAPRVRSGWMTLGSVRIGRRVFIGNSAVLPEGTGLEDGVLIGLMSLPPRGNGAPVPNGSSWFGSPPLELPMRYHSAQFSESETYHPPRRLMALRLFIELFRIFLPPTIFVVLASLIVDTTDILQDYMGLGRWLLTLPFLYVATGIVAILITAFIKWTVVGRYRSGERPLWSHFVWRNDLVNGVYSNFCEHFFLNILRGTPFLAWALRAFGMKIGKRCYMDTTWYTEFDLIEIGDEVALNESANIQTHLFEDRVIKIGSVFLGNRCVVGAMATVLYDTRLEEGVCLEDLSLLMKGETLPAGTRWHGIPARKTTS